MLKRNVPHSLSYSELVSAGSSIIVVFNRKGLASLKIICAASSQASPIPVSFILP